MDPPFIFINEIDWDINLLDLVEGKRLNGLKVYIV